LRVPEEEDSRVNRTDKEGPQKRSVAILVYNIQRATAIKVVILVAFFAFFGGTITSCGTERMQNKVLRAWYQYSRKSKVFVEPFRLTG
jgi:hypothetical protein